MADESSSEEKDLNQYLESVISQLDTETRTILAQSLEQAWLQPTEQAQVLGSLRMRRNYPEIHQVVSDARDRYADFLTQINQQAQLRPDWMNNIPADVVTPLTQLLSKYGTDPLVNIQSSLQNPKVGALVIEKISNFNSTIEKIRPAEKLQS